MFGLPVTDGVPDAMKKLRLLKQRWSTPADFKGLVIYSLLCMRGLEYGHAKLWAMVQEKKTSDIVDASPDAEDIKESDRKTHNCKALPRSQTASSSKRSKT